MTVASDGLGRRVAILGWLHARRTADVDELARVLGVEAPAVEQDLEILQTHLADIGLGPQLDIDDGFVAVSPPGVRIDPVAILPPGRLSQAELLRIQTAGWALASALPDAEAEHLRTALAKIAAAHAAPTPPPPRSTRFREELHAAIEEGRRLRLSYRGRGDDRARDRVVDPHSIAIRGPHAYLWGHAEDRDAERAFRLDRIEGCEVLDQDRRVQPPEEPRAAPRYGPTDGDVEVTLLLDREAWWLLDLVHPDAEPTRSEDGRVEVRFRTDAPGWFEEAVIATGGAAVVVDPPSLAERVAEAARAGLELYADG